MSQVVQHCQPLVSHPIHLLLGHVVLGDHVSAHVAHQGVLLLADWTARLPAVLLHVLAESAPVVVRGSTDWTAKDNCPLSCGQETTGWLWVL